MFNISINRFYYYYIHIYRAIFHRNERPKNPNRKKAIQTENYMCVYHYFPRSIGFGEQKTKKTSKRLKIWLHLGFFYPSTSICSRSVLVFRLKDVVPSRRPHKSHHTISSNNINPIHIRTNAYSSLNWWAMTDTSHTIPPTTWKIRILFEKVLHTIFRYLWCIMCFNLVASQN